MVQTRHREWAGSSHHRRRASVVSLQFALPGLMSFLSLASKGRRHSMADRVGAGVAAALFSVVGAVAVVPSLLHDAGMRVKPLQVEATLLTLLVFVGLAVGWMLLFEEMEGEGTGEPA